MIQHNKFYLNKYLLIENQVQEEDTMCEKFKNWYSVVINVSR